MITHPELVKALAKPGPAILKSLTQYDCNLVHMVMGVSGEAGELLDAVKKHVIYRKPLDHENVVEELGDIEFFMEGVRQALGITREQTIEANIKKLSKRYAEGYSDTAAQVRADKADKGKGNSLLDEAKSVLEAVEVMQPFQMPHEVKDALYLLRCEVEKSKETR